MDKKDELTQIVKIVQKDKKQFELLYSHIIKKVYFWCYNIVGDEAEAKDATQEVMIRVYNKLDTLRTVETFNSWLYRLARNCSLNYIRNNKKREYEYLYSEDYNDNSESMVQEKRTENLPQDAYDLKVTKNLVNKFVNKLPKRQKEVITLFYLEEMRINEIAEALDYNSNSVRSCLHAGRANLEKLISEYQEENNVKLYGVILFPMLGTILAEYRESICAKQDLSYEGYVNYSSTLVNSNKFISTVSKHFVAIISMISIIGILVLMITSTSSKEIQKNRVTASTKAVTVETLVLTDLELFNKHNRNPYIKSINYLTFPSRTGVEVSIELKEEGIPKNIEILYNEERLSIEKKDNIVLFEAKENGDYTILIDEDRIVFAINKIDQYAPEVTGIKNYETYLQIYANDEQSQINYDESYLIKDGEKFQITEELKVYGEFHGFIQLVIYDNDGFYIGYSIDVD